MLNEHVLKLAISFVEEENEKLGSDSDFKYFLDNNGHEYLDKWFFTPSIKNGTKAVEVAPGGAAGFVVLKLSNEVKWVTFGEFSSFKELDDSRVAVLNKIEEVRCERWNLKLLRDKVGLSAVQGHFIKKMYLSLDMTRLENKLKVLAEFESTIKN